MSSWKCTDAGAEFPRYTSKHPFVTSSLGEYTPSVSEKLWFFYPSCSLFKQKHCTTVVTKAGSALDAPCLPRCILSTEQFVSDASRTETVETDSLSQTHACEGEEWVNVERGNLIKLFSSSVFLVSWHNRCLPHSSKFWQLDLLLRTQSLNEILTLILVFSCSI